MMRTGKRRDRRQEAAEKDVAEVIQGRVQLYLDENQ